jgi:hypothetical protein
MQLSFPCHLGRIIRLHGRRSSEGGRWLVGIGVVVGSTYEFTAAFVNWPLI